MNKDFELNWMWTSLHNELVRLLDKIDKTKSNGANKIYVRTFFSMVEGISYRIRQILLERYKHNIISLTPEEYIVLSEMDIDITEKGQIKTKTKFYKFENIFRFTFQLYSKLYNKKDIYDKYISNNGFECFKNATVIRNRLTHPKTGKDIYVNGQDYIKTDNAWEWFHNFVRDLLTGDLIKEETNTVPNSAHK